MVTGDQHAIAVETCRRLGLGTEIMEGAELMGGLASNAQLAEKVWGGSRPAWGAARGRTWAVAAVASASTDTEPQP